MSKQRQRNIPICITFPPDLLAFYESLAEHEEIARNKLIIELLTKFYEGFIRED